MASTFEILGHVIHPLQDMASPPHTRNDIHGGFGFGSTSLFERYLDQEQVRPRLNFGGTPVRLDLPRHYWSTGDVRGLAEFVNRNFVSEGTNFTTRVEGAIGGGYPKPVLRLGADDQGRPFETTLDIQTQLEPGLRDRNGNLIDGSVSFFANNFQDPITGSALRNERMTTLSLFDRELERTGAALVFTLNRYNIEAQAAFLIPRAVGYSAGLLDYFFRGRLDVDLVEGPSGSSQFQLIGTNGSLDETLVDGELRLYADTPSGERSQVTTFAPLRVSGVDPGQPLTPIPPSFEPPTDAERFVAVYTGKLGEETPSGTFPGGVIGKVLGGVRVEEVFSDGTRWRLRTPRGVFVLQGLTAAEFEEVRWGDGDSLLVARTPFGPGQPNRVAAYEVPRQSNSVDLVAVGPPDELEVVLTKKNEAAFPFGMPLGTTVNFSHTIHYRQQLAIYQPRRDVYVFKLTDPNFPDSKVCVFDHRELGTPTVKTVAAQDVRFQGSFPITLDLARNGNFGTAPQPYVWYLREVGATADGRLLGLVLVFLTNPEGEGAFVPVIGLNRDTGAEEVVFGFGFAPTFPPAVGSVIWALVDLKTAELVASTADRLITITGEEAFEGFPDVWTHVETDFCGQVFGSWFNLGFIQPRPGDIINEDAAAQPIQNGLFGLTVDGWLKGELNGLEVNRQPLFGVQLGSVQDSGAFIYDCIPSGNISVCRAMDVSFTTGFLARGPAGLGEVRRSRPAPGGERLVFLAGAGRGTATPVATVVVWDATAGRAQVRHQFLEVDDVPELGPATGETLLASTLFLSGEQLVPRASFLIPLEGTQDPTRFPGVDLRESFVLLNPSYLYSVGDLKFFRPKPPLQPTALPARLADVPGNPVGDYHAIRLP
ncbi:MAG: hypothetical protein WAP47_04300 [Candidatus Rokuibacteriota bacterium]